VAKRSKRKARTRRTTLLLRWSVVATAVFVAFLYYRPLSSYVQTRASLNERAAEVRVLRAEKTRLEARLADSATVAALAREARRMRLVRPGERLYIVRGIKEWRRAQATQDARTTVPGDG
jgi:cell division protein FtsB